jgi:hypothetical protein
VATVDDLFAIAGAFLADSITALNLTTAGAPARAFVSPGEPALDCCDQLTVHNQILNETDLNLRTTSAALAAMRRIQRGGLAQVTVSVLITRCVPVPKVSGGDKIILPDPIDLQNAARTLDEDGWALWLGLSYALKHGDLAQMCLGAERLGGTKLTPQGGCGGWLFTYRYPIEGGVLPGALPIPPPEPPPEPAPVVFSDAFARPDGPLGPDWIVPFIPAIAGLDAIIGNEHMTSLGPGMAAARTALTFAADRSVAWTVADTLTPPLPSIVVLRGSFFDETDMVGEAYYTYLDGASPTHLAPIIRSCRDASLPILFDGVAENTLVAKADAARMRVSFVTVAGATRITWEWWDGLAWNQIAMFDATGADAFLEGGWVGFQVNAMNYIDDVVITEL